MQDGGRCGATRDRKRPKPISRETQKRATARAEALRGSVDGADWKIGAAVVAAERPQAGGSIAIRPVRSSC